MICFMINHKENKRKWLRKSWQPLNEMRQLEKRRN